MALVAGTVLCLADWVLLEDFGFLGGVGTGPNSMVPIVMLSVAGISLSPGAAHSRTGALTTWPRFLVRS